MQDNFTYTATTLNGHAPTSGPGSWVVTGSPTSSKISSDGTKAVISVNGGTLGSGQAFASYGFTPAANTIYTLQATGIYNGPIGTTYGWFGMGFSNGTGGGLNSGNTGPFIELSPQINSTSAGVTVERVGTTIAHTGTAAASIYSNPVVFTIVWNTSTGLAQYAIDGVLQWTATTALPTGTFYAFFGQELIGNAVNCANVTFTAQPASIAKMQDNFSYTVANINGHAPDFTPPVGLWSTNNSGGSSIVATGTQANLIANNGVPGGGEADANYAFLPSTNSFYTIRVTYLFNSVTGTGKNAWAGFGFSTTTNGGLDSGNTAPNLYIQPQATVASSGYASCNIGSNPVGGYDTVAAATYAAPITATITWNTATGEVRYYVNNILQPANTTTAALHSGLYYVFMQGFQTGSSVSIQNITLTSQSLPLPLVNFDPPWLNNPQFAQLFDGGAGSAQWASARTHVNYLNPPTQFFDLSVNPVDGPITTMANYLAANNIKLMVAFNAIVDTGSHPAGSATLSSATTEAARAKNAGATIAMLDMDEPLYWGHEYSGGALLPISTCAQNANQFIQEYKAYFPNVTVRDVEPMHVMVVSDMQAWIPAFQTAVGMPLVSLLNDIDWRAPLDQDSLTMVNEIGAAGVPYGICIDGVGVSNTSNEQWILSAMEAVQLFNANTSVSTATSLISFDDWDPYTTQIIPETSPASLTYLINYFFAAPQAFEPPPVALYRVYRSGIDYYTSNVTEYTNLKAAGWSDFGIIGGVEPSASCAIGLVPMYRYYKGAGLTILHSYAFTSAQQTALVSAGYTYDKVEGYVFPSTATSSGGVPLYCAYNPSTGDYWYNEALSVYQSQVTAGWTGEGIVCYLTPRWQTF